jgi:hypothetical protein
MDLDSVADELYSASPDEFVERRTRRVTEARAAKDRALVKAITALRRPTRSAWLVNLVAREAPEEVAALIDLGGQLADAQRRGSGPDLRRLSQQRHASVEALVRRAVALGADQGHTATDASRQEVTQTLQAALSDPAVAELVRAGRVVQPASYGGFGPVDLLAALTPVADQPAAVDASGSPADPSEEQSEGQTQKPVDRDAAPAARQDAGHKSSPAERARAKAIEEAEEVVRAATDSLERARQVARDAAGAAESETERADELADRVEALRAELAEAESSAREAAGVARAARKEQARAEREVTEAESMLAAAQDARATLAST